MIILGKKHNLKLEIALNTELYDSFDNFDGTNGMKFRFQSLDGNGYEHILPGSQLKLTQKIPDGAFDTSSESISNISDLR